MPNPKGNPRIAEHAGNKKRQGKQQSAKFTDEANRTIRRLGEGSLTDGLTKLGELLVQLEAIASLAEVTLDYLLEIAPHTIKAHAFNFEGVKFEGLFITYLSRKAAEGDTEAEQLLEMALLRSSAIAVEELIEEGKIGTSYIV